MKLLIVLAIVFLSSSIFAHPPVPDSDEINRIVTDLSRELTLDEAQQSKIKQLFISHFNEVKEKISSKERPKREEMELLKTSFELLVNEQLSKEQMIKFKAFLERAPKGDKGKERRAKNQLKQ